MTTLITEMYDVSEEATIKQVIRAQTTDFFTLHDEIPAMLTQERAVQDAMYYQIQQAWTAEALKQPKQARANTRKK